MVDVDRTLAALAAQRHSLLTLDDVVAAGGTRSSASVRVKAGRWESPHPGVYRIAGIPWSYEARVMAAVLAGGPGAVASHRCAARLLGIGFAKAEPEISVPRGRNRRRAVADVHESTDLDRCATHLVCGIPVTDPARTLLDLGRYIGHQALERAVEQARRRGLVDWPELIRCLVTHARQGRHGVRRLREVIAAGMARSEVTDTDSELIALAVIREHGLPEPEVHHRVYDGERLVAELDLAYPDHLVDIEIDGAVHNDPVVRQKDDARDHHLRRLGWTVRRIWCEVPIDQPAAFIHTVRTLLRDAETRRSTT